MSHKMENVLILFIELRCLLTGHVPIRHEDNMIWFTMEEWDYVEKHKDLYKDIMMINQPDGPTLSEKIGVSQPFELDEMIVKERILHMTEEVIHLLTKEKYILIWSLSDRTTSSSIDNVPDSSPLLGHERNKDQKILDLTNKIIHLLTGEVPIRYKDITIFFSMEEWEYVERYKDLYKDCMINNQIVDYYDMSPSKKCIAERPPKCPRNLTHSARSSSLLVNSEPQQLTEASSCTESGDYFKDRISLSKHKNIQQRESVPCNKCGKPLKGTTIPDVTDETLVSGPNSEATRKFCRPCLLELPCYADKGGRNTKKKPFSCVECNSSFSSKYTLKIHMNKHTSANVFTCPECGRVALNAQQLETHMRVHTGEKPFKCSECGKCFSNKGNLKIHYRVHTGEKPFSCSECDKTFGYKSHLVAHQRYHTGQTMECPECGMHFVYHSHFLKHLQIHTGVKPYKCPECEKCFHRSYRLNLHMKIHTGESPFQCEDCGKCYQFPSDLLKHQKIHKGEKPYSCSEWGKGFTHSRQLLLHKKFHLGETPYS
ncbi:zinc finger protein 260-like isoform X2 [Dendropsophus ebraccatus]|uniref:zinc finger protein 260-like isoform X2 n=1 Tax=Dendropsophus ebraccatus TaxID=150705 RepID=UPI003831D5BB